MRRIRWWGLPSVIVVGLGVGVSAPAQASAPAANPVGHVDAVTYRASDNTLLVAGWAGDADGSGSTQRVHVYVDGRGWRSTDTTVSRPDVLRRHPELSGATGFGVRAMAPAGRGTHSVCVYAINQGAGATTSLGCRSLIFDGGLIGHIDRATYSPDLGLDGVVSARGWVLDPYLKSSATRTLRFALAEKGRGTVDADVARYSDGTTGVSRPDVDRRYPNTGTHHVFTANGDVQRAGLQSTDVLCVYRSIGAHVFRETSICARTTTVD